MHSNAPRFLTALLLAFAALLPTGLRAQETAAIAAPADNRPLRGDVDGDGRVTTRDARLVTAHVAGGAQIPASRAITADADGDARISSRDALLIESFARGRATGRFDVGKPLGEDDMLNGLIRVLRAPADADMQLRTGHNAVGVQGDTLPRVMSLTLRDGSNNPLAGVAVFWEVTEGGGGVRRDRTATSDSGVSANRLILGNTEDVQKLRAFVLDENDAEVASVEFHATGVDASGLQIQKVSLDSLYGVAGDTLGVQQRVRVTANGQEVAARVTWQANGGGSVRYPVSHSTLKDGDARNQWILGSTPGEQTLVATAPGGASVTFTATAIEADSIQFTIQSGDNQSGTPGDSLAQPLRPRATYRDTIPVTALVRWTVVSGGGGLRQDVTFTRPDAPYFGITSNRWQLGPAKGLQQVQAVINNVSTSVVFNGIGVASGTDKLLFLQGDTVGTAGASLPVPPGVTLTDASDNPIPNYPVKFKITQGAGIVDNGDEACDSVFVMTDEDGEAILSQWILDATPGDNTVRASAGPLFLDFHARGTAGEPESLDIAAGDGQTATVNTAVATDPRVRVTDVGGNGVQGVAVTFAVESGGGSVTGENATTDADGYAEVGSWTLGTTAGANTLTASVTGLPDVTFSATGTADAATNMAATAGDGQSATVGTAVAVDPAVTVTDTYGNPVAGVAVTFAVASGGGSVTGENATTDAFGVATVGSWTLGGTAGANTLDASSTGLTTVTFTATGTAGAPANMVKSAGDGQSATVDTEVAIDPAVTITDAGGNPVAGVEVTFSVTGGGGSVTGGTATTDASGVATVGSWTLGTEAGANTLDASATGVTTVTFTATGTAGALDHFLVEAAGGGDIADQDAGTSFNIQVTAQDEHDNTVASFTGTVDITSSGTLSAGGGTTAAFTAGVLASHAVTITSTGDVTLTATRTGGTETGTSNTFTVDPGAPASMVKSAGDGQSATVGTAVSTAPAVTITDAHGNPVPGVSVTFAVPGGGGGGGVTGGSATTDAAGVATVGSWTLGTTAGANSLQASSTGLTTVTFSATGTPDVPANIAKTAGDGQTGTVGAAVAVAPQVTVTDQYGNATPGITVTFAVTGGGGSVTAATPSTNASGVATVGSWTLGGGPTANTLQASVAVGTASAVTFTAYVPPTAQSDSAQAMGNTDLPSSAGRNVLSNDVSINGGTLSLTTTGALATVRGGTLTLAEAGTFSYLPPAGNVLRDSVQYTISDGHASASGWVKIRFVGKVWYVDSGNGGSQDGRLNTPFTSVGAAATAAAANDTILVRTGSGTTAGGTLKAGQLVHGQGGTAFTTTLNGESVTLLAAGTDPSVGALTLGSGNTLTGFVSTGGITGAGFGTLTVSDVTINNPTGQALSLNNGTLAGSFGSVVSGGGTNNVSLTGVATSGTATLGTSGNTFSGATGDAVVISGGGGSFTIPAHITNSSSLAVNVNGKTGGTVTFSGNINPGAPGRGISVSGNSSGSNTISFTGTKEISSGTSAGVSLSNNTGATISFTGGALTVSTTTGTGFLASGGGTVEVSGSGNTVSVSGAAARAVELNGITIPAGNIAFSSITSSGTTTGTAFFANAVGSTGGGAFSAGSITVAGTTGASSRGIDLTSNSAAFTFSTASVNGTGAQGIFLSGNTAAVAVNGGSVGNTSSPAGDALSVSGGGAAVTVAATLTKSSAGRIANITGRTGGTTTVSGNLSCTGSCTGINAGSNTGGTIDFTGGTKTLNTGANAAVTLASNGSGTVNFTNGGLAITTTSGAGFNATTSGTVTVTTGGSPNTIQSTTGIALTVTDVNIGSNGLTFRSISAGDGASGPANGILLSNTGTSGFVTVTGDGSTAGSGGTIQRTSGANAAIAGNAVYLNGTRNVSLSFMNFNNTSNNGVYGTGVRGFTMNRSRFTASIGDSNNSAGSHNESAVQLVNVGGAVKLTNSLFNGTAYNAVRIENISGTAPALDSLVMDTDTVTSMQGSTADVRGSALLVNLNDGTADTRIRNSRITTWWGNAIHVLVQGTASGTTRITNNFTDNTNGALAGAGGIWVTGGNHAYNISGNTVRHTHGTAISADRVNFGTNMNGTISGNTIGQSGDNASGSAHGSAIFASHHGPGTTTHRITGNVIRQAQAYTGSGAIWVLTGDASGFGGSGTLNATIVSNNIQENGTVNAPINAHNGILVTVGTQSSPVNDTDQACLDIGGSSGALHNVISNFNSNTNRIRISQRFGTTSRFPGYTGTSTGVSSQTDLASYLVGRNAAGITSVNQNTSTGGFNNTSPAGSACPQPTI
ncbi:MAG TPA: Ig-like domain-containing protein [Longimicrobium sp.]|nr:Ig-like domain-containing protein [Longimicrobium sp.]